MLLQQIIDENLKFHNTPAVIPKIYSFFAQRNSSFHHKIHNHMKFDIVVNTNWRIFSGTWNNHVHTTIHPYELNPLNEGRSFDAKSGIFKAPFRGIYHF